jgi:DNA modification methylase
MYPDMRVLVGDVLDKLRELPDGGVQCVITSPPYWGLRDYSYDGQMGLEATPEGYVEKMVEVFREVKRVLRDDGTLWLNLGDSYASDFKGSGGASEKQLSNAGSRYRMSQRLNHGLKPKDLCGIPWRLAFALQADGWYLRSDIIWAKPNPMPESVTDRPTKAHEYIFLFSKRANYYYDAEAIREPAEYGRREWSNIAGNLAGVGINGTRGHATVSGADPSAGRNKRSVWTIATQPYPEAHFATFPEELPKICILAGTSAKGCCGRCGSPWERIVEKEPMKIDRSFNHPLELRTRTSGTMVEPAKSQTLGWQAGCDCEADVIPCAVCDPFAGSGTTGKVALELGRSAILIELNPKYVELIEQRCRTTLGLVLW